MRLNTVGVCRVMGPAPRVDVISPRRAPTCSVVSSWQLSHEIGGSVVESAVSWKSRSPSAARSGARGARA